jgi:hypothetical protein
VLKIKFHGQQLFYLLEIQLNQLTPAVDNTAQKKKKKKANKRVHRFGMNGSLE